MIFRKKVVLAFLLQVANSRALSFLQLCITSLSIPSFSSFMITSPKRLWEKRHPGRLLSAACLAVREPQSSGGTASPPLFGFLDHHVFLVDNSLSPGLHRGGELSGGLVPNGWLLLLLASQASHSLRDPWGKLLNFSLTRL